MVVVDVGWNFLISAEGGGEVGLAPGTSPRVNSIYLPRQISIAILCFEAKVGLIWNPSCIQKIFKATPPNDTDTTPLIND